MNDNFDIFNHAGTTGHNLDIDKNIFEKWIIYYFISKNVKYFITKKINYIVFPTKEFKKYFDINGTFRIKRSGSSDPSIKYQADIIAKLKSTYNGIDSILRKEKKLFICGNNSLNKVRFTMGNYEYYLAPKGQDLFEVRQLSNTYNMNVIFSIALEKNQDPIDYSTFVSEF